MFEWWFATNGCLSTNGCLLCFMCDYFLLSTRVHQIERQLNNLEDRVSRNSVYATYR